MCSKFSCRNHTLKDVKCLYNTLFVITFTADLERDHYCKIYDENFCKIHIHIYPAYANV